MITTNTDSVELIPAIAYLRFSPKPKDKLDPDTLDVQERRVLKYATLNNLKIVETLRDPLISARQCRLSERPEGQKLNALLGAGIRHVVAVRLDRIFRNTCDGLTTLEDWNERGITLHLADQGGCTINCSTATGEVITTLLLGIASFEPRLTAERTASSMIAYQASGRRMTRPDQLPWGHSLDPNDSDRMVDNPEELSISETICEKIRGGQSRSSLAKFLNENGVLCRGKPWNHASVWRAMKAIRSLDTTSHSS